MLVSIYSPFYIVTLSPFRSEGAKQINHPL